MDRITMTAEELANLQQELQRLETNGRRAMAARIKTAREWGDLKENGEYHAAKEDQAHLETRIIRLGRRLRNAAVVDVDEGGSASLAFGRSAVVRDEGTGETHTWMIVGGAEADRAEG